jgi:hypothetical protein
MAFFWEGMKEAIASPGGINDARLRRIYPTRSFMDSFGSHDGQEKWLVCSLPDFGGFTSYTRLLGLYSDWHRLDSKASRYGRMDTEDTGC